MQKQANLPVPSPACLLLVFCTSDFTYLQAPQENESLKTKRVSFWGTKKPGFIPIILNVQKCNKAQSRDHQLRLKRAMTGIWHHSQCQMYQEACFPWNGNAETTDDRNYFSPQMMMLRSVDLNWNTPLCSALGRKHWKCIYNWTVAHYTVTSYRDLLFSSRDKVSMPAREYNCLLLLSVHERLLRPLWLQPKLVECHQWECMFCTRVCWAQTCYAQFIPEVMLK